MKIKLSIWTVVLAVITLGAFLLRVYKVTEVPPSLSWDEVSIGYNAYSILKTGYDEHHRFLPLDTFAAYGDYKPPVSIYLTVITVALFGLNEFSVRLPSVLAGTGTVCLLFFFIQELFRYSTFKQKRINVIGILSVLLLSISPWHVQLSRAGFEANIALFFIVLFVFLFLKARNNAHYFIFCWIPLVVGVYTFNSARYFSPLLGLMMCFFMWKYIRNVKKEFLLGICIGFVLLLPIFPHLFSKEARLRYQEVNIFTDHSVIAKANERLTYRPGIITNILHNRRVGYLRSYLIHYVDHFQPWFLFTRGDGNPKFSIQDIGQFYPMEFIFLIVGILALFQAEKRVAWLLLSWLLLSIIPAAVARETPHALRIENSLPTWQIFIAYGIISVIEKWRNMKTYIVVCLIGLSYIFYFSYYIHNYNNHYAKEYSGEWQYGYREAIAYISREYDNYDSFVITDAIGRPYMYTLFYMKFDPQRYWSTVKGSFDTAGFYNARSFDKFYFVQNKDVAGSHGRVLYVLSPSEVPSGVRIISTINKLNGDPALVIFQM